MEIEVPNIYGGIIVQQVDVDADTGFALVDLGAEHGVLFRNIVGGKPSDVVFTRLAAVSLASKLVAHLGLAIEEEMRDQEEKRHGVH